MYGEKRISVDGPPGPDGNPMKLEYRVWNPFRSKLAAAILGTQITYNIAFQKIPIFTYNIYDINIFMLRIILIHSIPYSFYT